MVPKRIKAFGWRCLLIRLPTRDIFLFRGIHILTINACGICGMQREYMSHILFSCYVSSLVWKNLASWVGFVDYNFVDIWSSYIGWHNFFKFKKVKSGREGIFWLEICWPIWKVRNGIIFQNDPLSLSDIIWSIKELILRWSFFGKITRTNYD